MFYLNLLQMYSDMVAVVVVFYLLDFSIPVFLLLFFRSLKTTESKSDFLHAKKTTTTTTAAGHKKYLCFNTSVANILEYSNLKECKVQEKNLNCFRTWSPYYNFSIASAQQYHHFLENLFIQTIHSFKSCKNLSKLWLRK